MKITKEQVKDILIRTLKTLLVVALTAFVTAWVSSGMTNIEAALIAAGSTVGTMILNVVIKLIKNVIDDWKLTAEELADAFGGVEDDL
jgi:hypothetical protein